MQHCTFYWYSRLESKQKEKKKKNYCTSPPDPRVPTPKGRGSPPYGTRQEEPPGVMLTLFPERWGGSRSPWLRSRLAFPGAAGWSGTPHADPALPSTPPRSYSAPGGCSALRSLTEEERSDGSVFVYLSYISITKHGEQRVMWCHGKLVPRLRQQSLLLFWSHCQPYRTDTNFNNNSGRRTEREGGQDAVCFEATVWHASSLMNVLSWDC